MESAKKHQFVRFFFVVIDGSTYSGLVVPYARIPFKCTPHPDICDRFEIYAVSNNQKLESAKVRSTGFFKCVLT